MHRSRISRRFAVKLLLGATLLMAILALVVGCTSSSPEMAATTEPSPPPTLVPTPDYDATVEASIESTVAASPSTPETTDAPAPTAEARPTSTPRPTASPRPTSTPRPTATPVPTPTPRAWPFGDSDGDWIIDIDTDALTDEETILAWLRPRDHTTSSSGALIVRCGYDEGEDAEAIVGFDDELEGNIFLEVQYRFDDGAIETERWSISTNNRGLFARSPVEFIWRVMHAQELAIREETGQTLVFDVGGLANALYPHREKCNWIDPWHN